MGVAAHDVRLLYPQGMRESINANIRLTGSPQAAVLGGNVNLADLSFTTAFDLSNFINQFTGGVEAPPSQGFTQNVALNLAVHSSNNVNLVSRTLSVGGSANLQVRGTVAEPVILGRANLTGGDIILNGNRFVLTGGTIQFVNPSVTEPVVNLTLTTSIQQYNISLRFEGPVDQLRTQYSSDPSLPSADIIHLLAFGQTTEASAANATPANQAAETLVANQVSSQVTSRISKVAGISQLSINPVLAGSNSQGPAGANITVQQRVTGNLFVTFSSNVQPPRARPFRANTRYRHASPSAPRATPTGASRSTRSSRKAGESRPKSDSLLPQAHPTGHLRPPQPRRYRYVRSSDAIPDFLSACKIRFALCSVSRIECARWPLPSTLPTLKYTDLDGEHFFTLAAESTCIGRAPDQDLVLKEAYVSRRHALITRQNGHFELVDQNSSHGTFLNGQRVERATLKSGDALQFGSLNAATFRFLLPVGAYRQQLQPGN